MNSVSILCFKIVDVCIDNQDKKKKKCNFSYLQKENYYKVHKFA